MLLNTDAACPHCRINTGGFKPWRVKAVLGFALIFWIAVGLFTLILLGLLVAAYWNSKAGIFLFGRWWRL
jgi:hypothetical protein